MTQGLWELQFHPADARRPVRRWFLSPRKVRWMKVGLGAWLLFLASAAVAAPFVLPSLGRRDLPSLRSVRNQELRGLSNAAEGLEALRPRTQQLAMRLAKLAAAYGLPQPTLPAPQVVSPLALRDSASLRTARRGLELVAGAERDLALAATLVAAIEELERREAVRMRTVPVVSPLPAGSFVLTSGFGPRQNRYTEQAEFHAGLDLAALTGTPVRAPADGTVRFAGSVSRREGSSWWKLGELVVLDHGGGLTSLYGHLSTIGVRVGQKLRRGEPLGTVGASGWAVSSHLYYEVRRLGTDGVQRPVDPRFFVADHRWEGEEEMVARGPEAAPDGGFEPLP
ncbi:MAG TPA: M23 family metallopeptidase [Thermoanaerobaculia bacterium]|nr:M23 family metallopeptidase [Thermoanaerobaculia bacterium]